ncbi:MAG: type II toxin-antitoxin system HicA family toxin [Patescibacteria group bacterium]
MSKLPRLSGKEAVHLFEKNGWSLSRVKGSHHIMKSPDGRTAVIPVHGNATLHTGILNTLLRKHLKLSDEEIADL